MPTRIPLKRLPALAGFSRDHHQGLLLVQRIRQGLQQGILPVRISRYIRFFFETDLQPHFSEEELILFPSLAGNDPLRMRAQREHEILRTLIGQISQHPASPDLLSQFASLLEQHIRFEERELFGYIQDQLSTSQLQEIINALEEQQRPIITTWTDQFWNLTKAS